MKLLFINASPRSQGTIGTMLSHMQEEAQQSGFDTDMVRVSALDIRPCTGCMKCRSTLQCTLPPDDAQKVLQLVEHCDVLVIGAPCYWGNMPGTLKLLFDRIVYGMMGESKRGIPRPLHKGKRAIVVSACTTPYPFNIWFRQSRGAVNALKEILRWSGFKVVKCIEKGGTRTHPALTTREIKRCRQAIRRLKQSVPSFTSLR